jgi:hypothetical protein
LGHAAAHALSFNTLDDNAMISYGTSVGPTNHSESPQKRKKEFTEALNVGLYHHNTGPGLTLAETLSGSKEFLPPPETFSGRHSVDGGIGGGHYKKPLLTNNLKESVL